MINHRLLRYFYISVFPCFFIFGWLAASNAIAADNEIKNAPVDFQADRLDRDEVNQTITATGDVVLVQGGRTVKADKIVYYMKKDTVFAEGNVEFTDYTGDVHKAQRIEFNNALKDGFVQGLQTYLTDGSRFQSKTGKYKSGNKTVMSNASYTPCEVCKDNPDKAPVWQIRASDVIHDKAEKRVSYKHARFEVYGVPVAYLPYFSHPDGSVERKSGFLPPSAGFDSQNGAFVENRYYWDIAQDKDLTAGLRVMTDETPLGLLEYRQRWEDIYLRTQGSFTYSDRADFENNRTTYEDDELRGNIEVDGLWDINRKWRSGIELNLASDDQFLRQYDMDEEDVLENEAYVERFSGRDYAVGRILAFQDTRVEENREDQPNILPEIHANFLGDPNSVPIVGGRWEAESSVLGLLRNGNDPDMNRLGAALGWQRRLVSDFGFITELNTKLRGEFFDVSDQNTQANRSYSKTRGFGYIHAISSYPFVRPNKNSQIVIEPLASITVSPNVTDDDEIPNEDSLDVQIDTGNLFKANRFPGLDRVEDQTHVTYGLKTGIYGHDGSFGDIFVGQSYRFDDDEIPFSTGSGLDGQESDFVGKLTANYHDEYQLDYKIQLDNQDLSSERHEIDAIATINKFTLTSQYLYAKGLSDTDVSETREQVRNAASYYINDRWRVFGSARHDLGDDPGLREAGFGLNYLGQCISWSVVGNRTLTEEGSGDNGTEILFSIGLKNLGEFQTSSFSLSGREE
ncbi:MAG: LPS assembly protein LptD [Alphaproteobacteria bacterium]|nr:LPS assembly protein LptD [Alphaproteobacteria bacterium]